MSVELVEEVIRSQSHPLPERAIKSLASTIFESLCKEGCEPTDIIHVSSQLISLVTNELAKDS